MSRLTGSQNRTSYQDPIQVMQREALLGQQGCVVWLTGLSSSGKTTLADALAERLTWRGYLSYVLDGDNIRQGLNRDLGFSPEDRDENIRRVGEMAALFADCGILTITAFISPYRLGRDRVRDLLPPGRFIETYLDIPLEECERRDPKGLYRRVRAGELSGFTGIDAPYETPTSPELVLQTGQMSVTECVDILEGYLHDSALLSSPKEKAERKGRTPQRRFAV